MLPEVQVDTNWLYKVRASDVMIKIAKARNPAPKKFTFFFNFKFDNPLTYPIDISHSLDTITVKGINASKLYLQKIVPWCNSMEMKYSTKSDASKDIVFVEILFENADDAVLCYIAFNGVKKF